MIKLYQIISSNCSKPVRKRKLLKAVRELQPLKTVKQGTSLMVQWLGLHVSNAGGAGSIPGQGTKISHASWPKKIFFNF